MSGNLPVYRPNFARPNPNGSFPYRLVPGLRAANLPRPAVPVQFSIVGPGAAAAPRPQLPAAAAAPRPQLPAAAAAPRPQIHAALIPQVVNTAVPPYAAPRPQLPPMQYQQAPMPLMPLMQQQAPRPPVQFQQLPMPPMPPMQQQAPRPPVQFQQLPMPPMQQQAPRPPVQFQQLPIPPMQQQAPRPPMQQQAPMQYQPQIPMGQLLLLQALAALQGAPPPPPPPQLNTRTLIQTPGIQQAVLTCLTRCHNALYAPAFVEETRALLSAAGRDAIMALHDAGEPFKAIHLYKLIVKGGNAVILNERKSPYTLPGHGIPFPLFFVNDLDVSLLINPVLELADFTIIRNHLMKKLLQTINAFLQGSPLWPQILQEYQAKGVNYVADAYRLIVHHDEEAPVVAENAETEGILKDPAYQTIPVGCPFMISIHRNVTFHKRTPGANGQMVLEIIRHDLSLIQMGTRSMPEVYLFEVSVPSRAFVHLQFEWDMSQNHWLLDQASYKFFVMNPVGTYFDQKYAAAANTRPQKRMNRTRRAQRLKERIVNRTRSPQNGRLAANYNTKVVKYRAHRAATALPPNNNV